MVSFKPGGESTAEPWKTRQKPGVSNTGTRPLAMLDEIKNRVSSFSCANKETHRGIRYLAYLQFPTACNPILGCCATQSTEVGLLDARHPAL